MFSSFFKIWRKHVKLLSEQVVILPPTFDTPLVYLKIIPKSQHQMIKGFMNLSGSGGQLVGSYPV